MNLSPRRLLAKYNSTKERIMASTGAQTKKDTDTVKRDGEKAKPSKNTKNRAITDVEAGLVEDLAKHYGIEFTGDRDEFITECVKKSHELAKQDQQDDPTEEGRYDEKLGRLRLSWMEDDKDHPEIRKALEDAGINVGLTFNSDGTWHMHNGGKEDTGSSMDTNTILSAAKRLTNYQE
jgi:hypothetical protein